MTKTSWPAMRGMVGFDCGPDSIVYCEASADVLVLNGTAAAVCRALARGTPVDKVCRDLAAATNADEDRVARDVRQLVGQWRQLVSRRVAPRPAETLPAAVLAVDDEPCLLRYSERYGLADLRFELRSAEGADQRIAHELLGHLRDSRGVEPAVILQLVRRRGRWLLTHDGATIGECDAESAVAPMLHAATLMLAYESSGGFAALHAGAVVHDDQCILFPAVSGGGKSTLIAALAAAGYGYCTDDFVVLTGPPIRVRGLPVSIGLKQGSWDVLAQRVPALAELPIHVRTDGKPIRYVPMPAAVGEPLPARALIFSEYRPGVATTCRALRPADALLRLARAGYDTRLSAETVRAFVTWVCEVPSYELLYSELDGAIAAVETVIR